MRVLVAVLLCMAVAASAQEGFPLDGTWRAERMVAGGSPETVVLILQWDGRRVAGTINPGPNQVEFADVQLIPDGWKVTATGKDARGAPIVFEGVLSDLGKYNRALSGKWTQGGKTDDIRFVRE